MWFTSLFRVPKPAGPPQRVRSFGLADPTITRDLVRPDPAQDAFLIEAHEKGTARLFEIVDPGVESCFLTYRARMRSQDLKGRAYLEMWCALPGRGEFFSKGFHQAIKGTTDWSSFEIPFLLKKGQRPDRIKMNLVVEGPGKVWMKEIELLKTPLA